MNQSLNPGAHCGNTASAITRFMHKAILPIDDYGRKSAIAVVVVVLHNIFPMIKGAKHESSVRADSTGPGLPDITTRNARRQQSKNRRTKLEEFTKRTTDTIKKIST